MATYRVTYPDGTSAILRPPRDGLAHAIAVKIRGKWVAAGFFCAGEKGIAEQEARCMSTTPRYEEVAVLNLVKEN